MKKIAYLGASALLVFLLLFGCTNGSETGSTTTSHPATHIPKVIIKHGKEKTISKEAEKKIKVDFASRPINVMRQMSKYTVCKFSFGPTTKMKNKGLLVVSQEAYGLLLTWSNGQTSKETCVLNGTRNEICYVTSSNSKQYFEKAFNASCDSISFSKLTSMSGNGHLVETPLLITPTRMSVLSQAGVHDAGSSYSIKKLIVYPASKNINMTCESVKTLSQTEEALLSTSQYHPCSTSLEQKEMAVARCGPLQHVNQTAYENCLKEVNGQTAPQPQ